GRTLPLEELSQLLTGAPSERPTGLLGWNDGAAIGALATARDLGLDVPRDLSVIGFDSTPRCRAVQPALTSVYQPIRAMAEQAVDLLIARIEGSEPVPSEDDIRSFPCRLDMRASTGPARAQETR